jgi:hypothetical protein
MASTTSNPSGTYALTLSSAATYGLLAVALVASVLLSYVLKIWPDALGNVGIATSLTGAVALLSHDLTSAHAPSGFPQWTTFVIVSVATAAYAAVGVFSSQTLLEYGAALTWVVAFAQYLNTYISENGTPGLSASQAGWLTAGLGFALAVLTYILNNPNASLVTILVTAIGAFTTYFHLAETGTGGTSITPASATTT